ncbi:MAG TPA: hypothetical protein DEB70_09365, partial [Planctomycetaceae bacterium]|nr:hypothetical protein [Planctomycetaceae bacterium]
MNKLCHEQQTKVLLPGQSPSSIPRIDRCKIGRASNTATTGHSFKAGKTSTIENRSKERPSDFFPADKRNKEPNLAISPTSGYQYQFWGEYFL